MALNIFGKKKPTKTSKPKKTVKKIVKKAQPKKKIVKTTKKKAVKKKVVKKKPTKKKVVKKSLNKKKTTKKVIKKTIQNKKITKPAVKKEKPKETKPKIIISELEKMDDEKAYDLFKNSRLPVLKTVFIKKDKDLPLVKKVGFPCYMKVSSPKLIHKTEVDGIIKVNSEEEVEEAFKKLMKIKHNEKVLVQECKEGLELIIGAKYDSQFGHIVSLGIGGIYVEILKDVVFRICPIQKENAEKMIKELKGYDILAGAREQKPINFDSLIELLLKICNFASKNNFKELDINPLFCDETGCYISDIRIIK